MRILVSLLSVMLAAPAAAKVRVVTTTTDLAAIVREVGGDLVEVEALCRGGQDPHRVTATPGMVVALSQARLFVVNGLELEVGWVPELVRSARNDSIRVGGAGYVDASHRVSVLEIPAGPIDRSMGEIHALGNPHYTLDPIRVKRAAWNVANGLRRVDPANAAAYDRRLVEFYARADAAVARARDRMAPYQGARVIAYHQKYEYLLERIGLAKVGAIEPKPGIPPSAAHIARLAAAHRGGDVRLILLDPWYDRRVADRLAAEIGARVVVPCPAVGGCDGAEGILDLFERNVESIVAALSAAGAGPSSAPPPAVSVGDLRGPAVRVRSFEAATDGARHVRGEG